MFTYSWQLIKPIANVENLKTSKPQNLKTTKPQNLKTTKPHKTKKYLKTLKNREREKIVKMLLRISY